VGLLIQKLVVQQSYKPGINEAALLTALSVCPFFLSLVLFLFAISGRHVELLIQEQPACFTNYSFNCPSICPVLLFVSLLL
jgi:hypothetical protein